MRENPFSKCIEFSDSLLQMRKLTYNALQRTYTMSSLAVQMVHHCCITVVVPSAMDIVQHINQKSTSMDFPTVSHSLACG